MDYRNVPKTKSYPAHYVQTDDSPLVKQFLETFSTGKYTAPEMVEIAEQMGLKSKRGNRLNLDAIKYILKNPTGFYYGEWTYMGYSGKHRGLWEPIVEKKVILRNRALLKQQTSKYQKVSGKEWKFKKTNDKSRKLMIKLMTNKIIANFYKGDLPKKFYHSITECNYVLFGVMNFKHFLILE